MGNFLPPSPVCLHQFPFSLGQLPFSRAWAREPPLFLFSTVFLSLSLSLSVLTDTEGCPVHRQWFHMATSALLGLCASVLRKKTMEPLLCVCDAISLMNAQKSCSVWGVPSRFLSLPWSEEVSAITLSGVRSAPGFWYLWNLDVCSTGFTFLLHWKGYIVRSKTLKSYNAQIHAQVFQNGDLLPNTKDSDVKN